MAQINKIFGIGLPKSGTSSLHEALTLLGFRSRHNPDDCVTETEIRSANYRLSVLNEFDAITDTPVPAIFPQLDAAWPNSKFVLTTRPIESWLESSRRAGFNQTYAISKPGSTVEFYKTLLFGCNVFNEERFRWVFETHHKLVCDYFSGAKSNQLLVLDLSKKVEWKELCSFLGRSVPDVPFPHVNRAVARKPLASVERIAVSLLVKSGVDYRWLRRMGNRIRNSKYHTRQR